MRLPKTSWFPVIIGAIALIAITAPYLYAASAGGDEYVFGGFLLNPLDGNSYLAKIFQGWEGRWRNQLAYSAHPGEGAYINLYYLFLGHLARIIGIPLIYAFHGARVLGAALLMCMLWRFYCAIFPDQRPRRLAFALAALGSGLGWILIPFGSITSDLWVAEMYPYLSSATNPHFPLGLALMLWLISPGQAHRSWRHNILRVFLAWLLSVVSPFGLVVVLGVLGAQFVYQLSTRRAWQNLLDIRDEFAVLLPTLIGGLPAMLYYLWVARADPVIAAWNAQNVTPSPPLWDLLISLSPTLIFALVGVWLSYQRIRETSEVSQTHPQPRRLLVDFGSLALWNFEKIRAWFLKRKELSADAYQLTTILVIWAAMGLILVYLPLGLQRRFLMGLFIPLAGLAALGLEYLAARFSWSYRSWVILLFTLSIPTNLVISLTGFHGARTLEPMLYLAREEARALEWITESTPPDALILASPALGNFIPAHTGRRVIYGHPYETINAGQEKEAVEQLFEGALSPDERQSFLAERGVDYIFCGPREQELGDGCTDWDYEMIFSVGQVVIRMVGN